MPRAAQPFTPIQDIEARRQWSEPAVAGVLTAELATFCQSGVSIVIAAVGADHQPLAGTAKACRITPAGRMRIYLSQPANEALLVTIGRGAAIAATFSAPRNHRSIQVKARAARQGCLANGDLDEVARQVAAFGAELVSVHYTQRFAAAFCAYRPGEIVAIEFLPDEAFVQTPGPGAGEQLS